MNYKENPIVPSVDAAAKFWSEQSHLWALHEPLEAEVISTIREHLAKTLIPLAGRGKFLDLCSGADFSAYYPSQVDPKDVTAVDISEKMLALNSAGIKKQADIRQGIPFQNETFEALTMFFGWRHLYRNPYEFCNFLDADMEKLYMGLFKEMYRVLKPGAPFILIDVPRTCLSELGIGEFRIRDVRRFAWNSSFKELADGTLFFKEKPSPFDSGTYTTQVDFVQGKKSNN